MINPIRIDSRSVDIVSGHLKAGDTITARVGVRLSGNRFRLHWNGGVLSARSDVPLREGMIIRARVSMGKAGMQLKLLEYGAGESFPGGTATTGARTLLSSALLRAAMPLPAEADLERMSSMLGRLRGHRMRLARLYADLLSRGVQPSADFIEGLDAILSGRGGYGSGSESSGGGTDTFSGRDGTPGDGNGPAGGGTDPGGSGTGGAFTGDNAGGEGSGGSGTDAESGNSRGAGGSGAVSDESGGETGPRNDTGSAEDASGSEPALLALINAVPGRGETWFYRRETRRLGGRDVRLSWKVRPSPVPAMALTVRDGERTMDFLLEGLDPARMDVHADRSSGIPAETWDAFRRTLALMNVHVGDTLLPMESSDGFTPGARDSLADLEGRS